MSISFKRNKEAQELLDNCVEAKNYTGNSKLEISLSPKQYNLLVDNMINPDPHHKISFEYKGIVIKRVGAK